MTKHGDSAMTECKGSQRKNARDRSGHNCCYGCVSLMHLSCQKDKVNAACVVHQLLKKLNNSLFRWESTFVYIGKNHGT